MNEVYYYFDDDFNKNIFRIFSCMLDISTVIKRTVLLFVQRRPVGMAPWEKFDPSDQPVVVKPCPPCKHLVRRYAGATLCTAELYVFVVAQIF